MAFTIKFISSQYKYVDQVPSVRIGSKHELKVAGMHSVHSKDGLGEVTPLGLLNSGAA